MFKKTYSAWSHFDGFFGEIDGFFSLSPYLLVGALLQKLFGYSLAQVVMLWLLLMLAWYGAFSLCRQLGASAPASTAGAWAYVFVPYVQVSVVQGLFTTGVLYLAILPWALLLGTYAAAEPSRRRIARLLLVAMGFAVLGVLGITPQLFFELVMNLVIWLLILTIAIARDRATFLKWAMGTASLMAAATLWWSVPVFLSYMGSSLTHATLPTANAWAFARESFLNVLRFNGEWEWQYPFYFPYAQWYDTHLATYAAGFLLVASSAFGIMLSRGRRLLTVRLLVGVALIMMFLSKGLHGPLADLTISFYRLPFMFLYQEPAGATLFSILLLAVVLAMTTDGMTAYCRMLRRMQHLEVGWVLALVTIAIAALSVPQMITGAIFHGANSTLPSMYVKLPRYWLEASSFINRSPGRGGVLVLPADPDQGYMVQYTFGYWGRDALASVLLSRPTMYLGGQGGGQGYFSHEDAASIAKRVQALIESRSKLTKAVLHDVGVRYVLFRGDLMPDGSNWVSVSDLEQVLRVQPRVFGRLTVFDIGPPQQAVGATSEWILGRYWNWKAGSIAELGALTGELPRLKRAMAPGSRPALVEYEPGLKPETQPGQLIWFSATPRNRTRVTVVPTRDRFLRASMAAEPTQEIVARMRLGDLPRGFGGVVTPLVTSRISDRQSSGSIERASYIVVNPVVSSVEATLHIDLTSDTRASSYALYLNGSPKALAFTPGDSEGTLELGTLKLDGGPNSVVVVRDLLPARHRMLVNASTPSGIERPIDMHIQAVASTAPTVGLAAPPPALETSGTGKWSWSTLGWLRLDVPLSDMPEIAVTWPGPDVPAGSLEARVVFSMLDQEFTCGLDLLWGQTQNLGAAINLCLLQNGRRASLSDRDAIRVQGLGILLRRDQEFLSKVGSSAYDTGNASDIRHALITVSTANRTLRATGRTRIVIRPRSSGLARQMIASRRISVPLSLTGAFTEEARVAITVTGANIVGGSVVFVHNGIGDRDLHRWHLVTGGDSGKWQAILPLSALWRRSGHLARVEFTLRESESTATKSPITIDVQVLNDGTRGIIVAYGKEDEDVGEDKHGIAEVSLPRLMHTNAPLMLPRRDHQNPRISLIVAGSADMRAPGIALQVRNLPFDVFVVHAPRGHAPFILTQDELYNRFWMALVLGSPLPHFLAHGESDGWRNVWYVDRPGSIVLINLAIVIECGGSIGGALLLIVLGLSLRRDDLPEAGGVT